MKCFIVVFVTIISITSHSQMNEVTGGNIGVSLFGGMKYNTSTSKAYKAPTGFLLGAGVTTSIAGVLYPEINYAYSKVGYGVDSLANLLETKTNCLGLNLNAKIPAFFFSLGKSSKGECWGVNINLLAGYVYGINFNNRSNFNYINKNDQALEIGIGIRPEFSGGHKSRVAWSYNYELVYRFDLNRNSNFSIENNSGWKQNGLFFRLTIMHYKTSDFLGGNKKKKSYKRKY